MPSPVQKSIAAIVILFSTLWLNGCDNSTPKEEQKTLLIYSGVTMAKAMQHLAEEFEKEHDVKISIHQGASGFLYDALKKSQIGDIYLPGSNSFRLKNKADGFLVGHVLVGYNRPALMVAKGNPKNITSDLRQLTSPKLSVVVGSPDSAIGRITKNMLDKLNITEQVYENAAFLTTDSHRIFEAIQTGKADVAINFYATGTWPEHRDHVDLIMLDPLIAKPKALELNLLKFSKDPKLARSFMDFAASDRGREIFYEYGFLTEQERWALQ